MIRLAAFILLGIGCSGMAAEKSFQEMRVDIHKLVQEKAKLEKQIQNLRNEQADIADRKEISQMQMLEAKNNLRILAKQFTILRRTGSFLKSLKNSEGEGLRVSRKYHLEKLVQTKNDQIEQIQQVESAMKYQNTQIEIKIAQIQTLRASLGNQEKDTRHLQDQLRIAIDKKAPGQKTAHRFLFEKKGQLDAPALGRWVKSWPLDSRNDRMWVLPGLFIETQKNSNVAASETGTVGFSGTIPNLGPTLIIRHDLDYSTVYSGVDLRSFKNGEKIEKGQILGNIKKPLWENRFGVYFEIRHYSKVEDPLIWLARRQPE